jgi:hypothetical protein
MIDIGSNGTVHTVHILVIVPYSRQIFTVLSYTEHRDLDTERR